MLPVPLKLYLDLHQIYSVTQWFVYFPPVSILHLYCQIVAISDGLQILKPTPFSTMFPAYFTIMMCAVVCYIAVSKMAHHT